jgi:hypothetical protein
MFLVPGSLETKRQILLLGLVYLILPSNFFWKRQKNKQRDKDSGQGDAKNLRGLE